MSDFIHSLHKEFPPDAVPRRVEGYYVQKIPCCYFLKNDDSRHYIKLNDSALVIWELCDGDRSVGEILQVLREGYPDAAESMERDLNRVLDEFDEEKVLLFD